MGFFLLVSPTRSLTLSGLRRMIRVLQKRGETG
jgi:hypothetical protein